MKKKVLLTLLFALSALLCSCREPVEPNAETPAVTEMTASEPVDCCGGEIPDCCKEKEESKSGCCEEKDETKSDCCEKEPQSECCKNHKS